MRMNAICEVIQKWLEMRQLYAWWATEVELCSTGQQNRSTLLCECLLFCSLFQHRISTTCMNSCGCENPNISCVLVFSCGTGCQIGLKQCCCVGQFQTLDTQNESSRTDTKVLAVPAASGSSGEPGSCSFCLEAAGPHCLCGCFCSHCFPCLLTRMPVFTLRTHANHPHRPLISKPLTLSFLATSPVSGYL